MKVFRHAYLLIAACLLCACMRSDATADGQNTPIASFDTPSIAQTAVGIEMEYGESVMIDKIEPLILESFPLQVHAQIQGTLPDGCTEIERHEVEYQEGSFIIHIYTKRPVGAFCTEALVPFEYSIPLDVYGLPAGKYGIKAYGAAAEFTFDQDNISQASGSG